MNREEYRSIKNMSRQEMERWLYYEQVQIQNVIRAQYEKGYKMELDNAIQNFLFAIAYTLHFSDSIKLKNDELASLIDDLFVSVDMFRKGEWRPEEYEAALAEDGVKFNLYDYDKIYREVRDRANLRTDSAIDFLKDKTTLNEEDMHTLKEILGGE